MVSVVTGRCFISRSILHDVRRNSVLLRTNGILPQLTIITISDSSSKEISLLQGCGDCMLQQSRGFSGFSRKLDSGKYRDSVRNGFPAVLFPSQSGLRNSHQFRYASGDTSHYYTTTDFFPVKLAQDYTLAVHDFTGLPWWASIILCTVMLRTVITLPLFIVAQRNIARYANVNKDMVEVSEVLKAEVFHFSRNKNLSLQETKNLYSQQVKKQLTKKIEEHNCHPARSFLVGLIQLPAWMSMSCAVRNLCGHSYGTLGNSVLSAQGITDGGILWLTDLSVPDPLFILPCLMGMTNLILTEMHWLSMDSKITSKPLGMRIMHNSFRFISVWLMYVATTMPSGLVLYWFTSSLFGAIQYIVLQQPRLRRAVRIPKIDGESTTPMKDIAKAARIKYLRQKD